MDSSSWLIVLLFAVVAAGVLWWTCSHASRASHAPDLCSVKSINLMKHSVNDLWHTAVAPVLSVQDTRSLSYGNSLQHTTDSIQQLVQRISTQEHAATADCHVSEVLEYTRCNAVLTVCREDIQHIANFLAIDPDDVPLKVQAAQHGCGMLGDVSDPCVPAQSVMLPQNDFTALQPVTLTNTQPIPPQPEMLNESDHILSEPLMLTETDLLIGHYLKHFTLIAGRVILANDPHDSDTASAVAALQNELHRNSVMLSQRNPQLMQLMPLALPADPVQVVAAGEKVLGDTEAACLGLGPLGCGVVVIGAVAACIVMYGLYFHPYPATGARNAVMTDLTWDLNLVDGLRSSLFEMANQSHTILSYQAVLNSMMGEGGDFDRVQNKLQQTYQDSNNLRNAWKNCWFFCGSHPPTTSELMGLAHVTAISSQMRPVLGVLRTCAFPHSEHDTCDLGLMHSKAVRLTHLVQTQSCELATVATRIAATIGESNRIPDLGVPRYCPAAASQTLTEHVADQSLAGVYLGLVIVVGVVILMSWRKKASLQGRSNMHSPLLVACEEA